MGFKGRALASVKVTSEESPVPRRGTVGGGEVGRARRQTEDKEEQLRGTG